MQQDYIMFYNVENLFSFSYTEKKSATRLNIGLKNWNKERYEHKIKRLSRVFELSTEKFGTLPCLIGLAEVEGKAPLKDLVKQPVFQQKFGIVHYDSMDERGIDVALLYDKNKIKIIHSEPITFIFEEENQFSKKYDTTRDVLYCKINFQNILMHIFIVHLPSKREQDVNKPKREYILTQVKKRILNLSDTDEPIMIMGDFNENPNDEPMVDFLHDTQMKNPFLALYYNQTFSTFHKKIGLLYDQMIFSQHFFNKISNIVFERAEIFSPATLMNWERKMAGKPFRTYSGTRYLGGYSDHFPVISKIKYRLLKS